MPDPLSVVRSKGKERESVPDAPPKLMYVEDVCSLLRQECTKKRRRWVLERVAPDKKRRIGSLVFWYEADVLDWLEKASRRSA